MTLGFCAPGRAGRRLLRRRRRAAGRVSDVLLSAWLRARDARLIAGRGAWAVARLGFRSAAFRPARSVLSAALIASAAFIIVSVDAFRRGGGELTERSQDRHRRLRAARADPSCRSFTNPNDRSGREALLIQAPELAGRDVHAIPRAPGPGRELPESLSADRTRRSSRRNRASSRASRFTFAASLAETDAERANPWLLLQRRQSTTGRVPVIADATSLQYVLHASVGDTFSMDIGAAQPIVLRFVGALQRQRAAGRAGDGRGAVHQAVPGEQGYRMFLVDEPGVRRMRAAATRWPGRVERSCSRSASTR